MLRRIVLVMVLLALAVPAFAQDSNDFRIVAGERIGPFTLNDTQQSFVEKLGSNYEPHNTRNPEVVQWSWEQRGIDVGFEKVTNRTVAIFLGDSRTGEHRQYKTPEGVGLGNTRGDVTRALGEAPRMWGRTVEGTTQVFWAYDTKGLIVIFVARDPRPNAVSVIGVFKPGEAEKIWPKAIWGN